MLPAPDPDIRADDLHMAFMATPATVRESLARLLSMPPLCHLPEDRRATAELVLAEVLNNVVEHAYADQSGPVSVMISQTPQGLRCAITDRGKAMPGGRLPDGNRPDPLGKALEDLPEGGFGWHLIHSLTADLRYARVDDGNQLQFTLR